MYSSCPEAPLPVYTLRAVHAALKRLPMFLTSKSESVILLFFLSLFPDSSQKPKHAFPGTVVFHKGTTTPSFMQLHVSLYCWAHLILLDPISKSHIFSSFSSPFSSLSLSPSPPLSFYPLPPSLFPISILLETAEIYSFLYCSYLTLYQNGPRASFWVCF